VKAEKNLERTSQAFYSTFINLCQTSVNRTPTPSLCGDPVLKLFLELSRGDLPFVAVLTLLKKPTVSKNEESPKPYEHKRVILRSTTGAPGGIRTHDPWFRRPMLYPLSYGRLGPKIYIKRKGERRDSNPRSPGPQPGALNHSATPTTTDSFLPFKQSAL
jgi:hypothetical protein